MLVPAHLLRTRSFQLAASVIVVVLALTTQPIDTRAQRTSPEIPRTWDDAAVEGFHLPLAQRERSPRFISAEEYYKLRVRPVYRTYPVYVPGREPAGYMASLRQKEPEIVFDPATFRTDEDWIRAGELVFDAPNTLAVPPANVRAQAEGLQAQFLQTVAEAMPPTRDGTIPYLRYTIVEKGVVVAGAGCQICHTRVMPDGLVVKGAQGNLAIDRLSAKPMELALAQPDAGPKALMAIRDQEWIFSGVPWIQSRAVADSVPLTELIRRKVAMPPGVQQRQGTTSTHPPHIPSLIGIGDLKYLDATGLVRHRSIGDLMRYAALNYGLDMVAHYGDFQPSPQMLVVDEGTRYSDEQLYALARYLYSLKPPPNPNQSDALSRRGQAVFEQQRCGTCHTPPLYTNNMLTPAPGFVVPDLLRKSDAVMGVSVGTDPKLTMESRRGTGFYKVPSLRGVWYRNAFGHNGQAETLEEWFDASRLRDDYVPGGFHLGPGAIRGHEFGLRLPTDDRRALIAFLKTL